MVTHQEQGIVTSLSTAILNMVRNEPSRIFMIKDFTDSTNAKSSTVRKTLSRLSSSRKGSGPIIRVDHGLYKYDPVGEDGSLHTLIKYGYWRVENLVFVTKGARGTDASQSKVQSENFGSIQCDKQTQPQCKSGYPWDLPTGQRISWDQYSNGTETIRLSANGSMPFNPDHVLTLLKILGDQGFNSQDWDCVSIEANIEGRKWEIDGSFSVMVIKGLLLKIYQHGPSLRIELADRRRCTLQEVITFLHAFSTGFDGSEALKIARDFESRLTNCEKESRIAVNMARKANYRKGT